MPAKKTKEQLIENLIQIYGSNYLYNEIEYVNNKTKVKIICTKHGEFYNRPDMLMQRNGCFWW